MIWFTPLILSASCLHPDTLCLLLFATSAGNLLDSVKSSTYNLSREKNTPHRCLLKICYTIKHFFSFVNNEVSSLIKKTALNSLFFKSVFFEINIYLWAKTLIMPLQTFSKYDWILCSHHGSLQSEPLSGQGWVRQELIWHQLKICYNIHQHQNRIWLLRLQIPALLPLHLI